MNSRSPKEHPWVDYWLMMQVHVSVMWYFMCMGVGGGWGGGEATCISYMYTWPSMSHQTFIQFLLCSIYRSWVIYCHVFCHLHTDHMMVTLGNYSSVRFNHVLKNIRERKKKALNFHSQILMNMWYNMIEPFYDDLINLY